MPHSYARTTALVPENSASGFGVLTEGKWLKFDSAGNVQALDLLRNTKTEKGIMVVVTGSLKGDELSVSSIRETPASGFRKNY